MTLIKNRNFELIIFSIIGFLLNIPMIWGFFYCIKHPNETPLLAGGIITFFIFYLYFYCDFFLHDKIYQKIFTVLGVILVYVLSIYSMAPMFIELVRSMKTDTVNVGDIIAWITLFLFYTSFIVIFLIYLFVIPPLLYMVNSILLKKQKPYAPLVVSYVVYLLPLIFLSIRQYV